MISVEKGRQHVREINRVVFDPDKTNFEEIKERLIRTGTFVRTSTTG